MAKKMPETYDLPMDDPPSPEPVSNGKPRKKRPAPVTMAEVFDEETRIVRLLLKRVAALPNEQSRTRVINRVYELREFPLVDQAKEKPCVQPPG